MQYDRNEAEENGCLIYIVVDVQLMNAFRNDKKENTNWVVQLCKKN